MAGNFSFGDFFKGAIELAWSLLTNPVDQGGYGFDPEKLWATVYLDDDEAADLWLELTDVPAERIQRRGMADNYWSMGIPGPCGPSSEIYYDRGPEYGAGVEGGPEANEDRYIEIWNLVFMQNIERGEGTSKDDFEILGPLPRKNIDTGMGVERVACLLQDVDNVYETDLLRPVIDLVASIAPRGYGTGNHGDDVRYRIIADHSRTAAIIIADGVSPGNDGRGYVLRRLLRRMIRSAKLLGIEQPIVADIMATVRDANGPSYPELVSDFDRIQRIAVAEETAFNRTLVSGSPALRRCGPRNQGIGCLGVVRTDAFTLHDTYGFPIELTLEMAAESDLSVDEEGFRGLMAETAPRKADAGHPQAGAHDLSAYRATSVRTDEFSEFDELSTEAEISRHLVDGKARLRLVSPTVSWKNRARRAEGNHTPLYAESGIGSNADRAAARGRPRPGRRRLRSPMCGRRENAMGASHQRGVRGVRRGRHRRRGRRPAVAPRRNAGTLRHHHMVHAALRQVLQPNAVQAGSLNRPGYLRFDFNWQGALSEDQRTQIEEVTNQAVEADYAVNSFTTDLEKAKSMGAMALFGEAYPEEVRVVEIGGRSRSNCAAARTSTIRRRSAPSRFSVNRRSAPACGAWRHTSDSIRSGTSRRNGP